MAKPIVALIGRPNVGKSTFFNYIIGEKKSIVEDTPGVTRDRVYADTEWRGRKFTLIDTGGIEPHSNDEILVQMRRQAEIAMETADVIIFLTDIKEGVTAADHEVANMLRRTKKPIVLVCNKADKIGDTPDDIYEFYNLGLGDPLPVSSLNQLGTGEVLDAIYQSFPEENEADDDDEYIRVALIGKPNVGKSSMINKILGEDRHIVSNVAGTTRDAVDSKFENQYGKYVFIDTAGIRRKSKIEEMIEKYSIIRAKAAIDNAHVCVLVIDATEGVTDQDAKIAGEAHEAGKGVIILINKWDLVEKETGTLEAFKKDVYNKLAYLTYAPILFVSAVTGQRVDKLFPLINSVNEQNCFRATTGMLNTVIEEAITLVQPPSDKGRRLKIYYATQASTRPPTFVVFCNSAKLFHFSYQRYIENQIRKNFGGLEGTPVRIIVREKSTKEDK
jgi:GTP-binding protein